MPMNSMQVDMQGAVGGFSSSVGGLNVGLPSISHQLPKEHMSGREVSGKMVKGSTVLAHAWKEETDAGHLLASLFEYFGESVFTFMPKSELSLFL
ncbi:transcription initiation factor TFIID subunit 6 [Prunus yedoensis var. nudiflora]|uniref:Transcription initiation factor TFIID subunit 6 n=1 Tax=Prunus yedoensis var. nudiflora TaxID=2094558 RepID=A0A314YN68_PRUYE|nr:transcription initiation factor TFIID subunit 6 [Prunus yedoensis var. nudiflora]